MRVLGISVVCLLSLCLLTYGFTGVSFAQSDQPPLSVNTDQNLYTENAKITVSGTVKDSSLLFWAKNSKVSNPINLLADPKLEACNIRE